MEPLFLELAKYGLPGIVAFLFYKLYSDEKKAHEITRGKLIDSLGARLADSQQIVTKVTDPLSTIAYAMDKMSNKIEASKGNNK